MVPQSEPSPTLNRKAKIYIYLVNTAGCAVLAYSLYRVLGHESWDWLFLAFLAATGGALSVRFPKFGDSGTSVTFTLSDIFVYLAILWYGPYVAVLISSLDILLGNLKTSQRQLYRILFNFSNLAITTLIAAHVFYHFYSSGQYPVSRVAPLNLQSLIVSLGIASITLFLLNSGSVSRAISLVTPANWLRLWKNNFLWTSLPNFAGAAAAAIVVRYLPFDSLYVLAVTIPIVLVIYVTYRVYLDRISLAQRHVQELNELVAELETKSKQLEEAKIRAEAANQAKSQFLANMSHEIRTPMNAIIGMTGLALDTESTSEKRRYLETVRSSADSLLSLINDILDFSKIEAGRLDFEPLTFSLRESLAGMLKVLALRAHEKGLELAYRVAPDVPDSVVGDPGRLRQVIVNLVGNAIKFTDEGEVVLRVHLDPEPGVGVLVHFAVGDTGIGIAEDKKGIIFEHFAQADGSTTRKYGGTGLGLAISSRLVELMGGRIWVDSQVGQGSVFHFTARFDIQGEVFKWQMPRPPVELTGTKVLVADDSTTLRDIVVEMLHAWQMQPVEAANGLVALDLIEQALESNTPFQLVLIDAGISGLDGFAIAERLPAEARHMVLMLASAGGFRDSARCRTLGAGATLTKPIAAVDLLEAITRVLGLTGVPAESPLISVAASGDRPRPLRLLLAEDNSVNQEYVLHLLEKRGHKVILAENGREAVSALISEGPFDLVLMDLQMPEMDGFEATAAIRESEKNNGGHLPIVALTASAMKGDRERCLEAGMDGYVTKPIQPEQLLEAIQSVTEFRGQGSGVGIQGSGFRD
ncbi:MAG: response regulator [Acidobacteriota bacterium]